jgi:glycine/D-amino acid oxidase-like deaminating enzyme
MDFASAKLVLWVPTDGYMRPQAVVNAYAHRCRKAGVRFATSTGVQEIVRVNGRVAAVRTPVGLVHCKTVINAAGAHAYHIARMVGLELPIVPVRHEYFVSTPIDGLHAHLPCFRIPDLALYGRPDETSLLLGGWEPKAVSIDPRSYALNGAPPPVEPDTAVLKSFADDFAPLFPGVQAAGTQRIGKGWPTFTPDGRFVIGPTSRVPGFVMAGGCNAHGISGSAGIGALVVESMLEPKPSLYVRSLSPDRFYDTPWEWAEAMSEARNVYETYYDLLV